MEKTETSDQFCKRLNGIRYKNICVLQKKYFNGDKEKFLENNKFQKREDELFIEFKKPRTNHRVIVIKLSEPTHEIDRIVERFYYGSVADWGLKKFIIESFRIKNGYLTYLEYYLDFLQKNIRKNKQEKIDTCTAALERYKAILQNIVGGSVIDVGSATGLLPLLIKKKYPQLEVKGSDAKPLDSTKILAEKKKLDVSLVCLDIASDDISQFGTYDTVVCSHVLEHLPESLNEKAMSNLLRLTRRRLIIIVPLEKKIGQTTHLQKFDRKKLLNLCLKFSNEGEIKEKDMLEYEKMVIIDKLKFSND